MNIWTDYRRIPLPDLLSFIVDNRGKTVPTADDGNRILIATNCIRNENLYPSYAYRAASTAPWASENRYDLAVCDGQTKQRESGS